MPCRLIGGDFFDYVDLASGVAGFAVADVAGKGASAALLTAVVQGILDAEAQVGAGPAETVRRINEVLVRRAVQSRFVTMVSASCRRMAGSTPATRGTTRRSWSGARA